LTTHSEAPPSPPSLQGEDPYRATPLPLLSLPPYHRNGLMVLPLR
jgi:hypothetical protein